MDSIGAKQNSQKYNVVLLYTNHIQRQNTLRYLNDLSFYKNSK